MRLPLPRSLAAALGAVVFVAGCQQSDQNPVTETSSTVIDEGQPLGDDEVTQHLLEAPPLPAPLAGAEVTPAELRRSDLTERNVVELVDVPDGAELSLSTMPADDSGPLPGALLRVPDGATVTIDQAVDVATLDGDVVGEVRPGCAAPCMVEGPALVSVDAWMAGFRVEPGWELLVPAPTVER